ncbi:MAG TPA: YciI family protein [Kofleriaceae bacterium]|jgi:hypothetical protein
MTVAALSKLVPGHAAAELAPHVEAHIAFMTELEHAGVLVASGPFRAAGANTGEGLTIVRAASLAAAHEALAGDPFVRAGLRTWQLHEWHVVEGKL